MEKEIKVRMLELDINQARLIDEVNSRFGERLDPSLMSLIIKGRYKGPLRSRVMEEIETVLAEHEKERSAS